MKTKYLLWCAAAVLIFSGSLLSIMDHFKEPEVTSAYLSSGDVVGRMTSPDAVVLSAVSGDFFPSSEDMTVSADVPGTETVSEDPHPCEENTHLPAVAVVIDDFGYSLELAGRLADLSIPVTWSIIPEVTYSTEVMDMAEQYHIPFLIHVPMQAISDEEGGPYLIGEGMGYSEIRNEIHRLSHLFPHAVGINNHRGSKATSDEDIMTAVIDEIAEEGLMFLDSRTSSDSVAYSIARKKGIPALFNSIFLDHVDSSDFMSEQLKRAEEIALDRGWVVVICHVRPGTVAFLSDLCIKADNGVEFFTVPGLLKMLMEYKEVSQLERKS